MKNIVLLILLGLSLQAFGQEKEDLIGRWDLTVTFGEEELPSWLEITKSGHSTLVGQFVYAFGSARPISVINYNDGMFSFSIPPQWEEGDINMRFRGKLVDGNLEGSMIYTDGKMYNWTGVPAPKLNRNMNPKWGKTIDLFNGKDLTGWQATGDNQWIVEEGILKNPKAGSNLVTVQKFQDFKLKVEFRYPEGSNSGIFLRGRYEVQIMDSTGEDPSSVLFGGIYGFLTPNQMAAKNPGEWQTYDITLIGRRVTIIANGIPIIQDQIIPGITGGALDSNEGEPGPIFLQGDHGPVEFKKMTITPVKE